MLSANLPHRDLLNAFCKKMVFAFFGRCFRLQTLLLRYRDQEKMSKPNIVFAFGDDRGRYASAYAAHQGDSSPHHLFDTPMKREPGV